MNKKTSKHLFAVLTVLALSLGAPLSVHAQGVVNPNDPAQSVTPTKTEAAVAFTNADSGAKPQPGHQAGNNGGQISDDGVATTSDLGNPITDTAEVKVVAGQETLPNTSEDTQLATAISTTGLVLLIALAMSGLKLSRTRID